MPPASSLRLTVRRIEPATHLAHLERQSLEQQSLQGRSASFLQTPAWGLVKSEWEHESLGWFAVDGELVGVALVLYRRLPRLRQALAYLPEGPVIDWETDDLAGWLDPLVRHLRRKRAFGVRIGPPVVTGRWTAAQVKDGIARDDVRRLADLPPTERSATGARVVSQLQELGWRPQSVGPGFAAGQPRHNFWLPLVSTDESGSTVRRSEDDVLRGMNQLWRRNIKRAAKEGVVVAPGSLADGGDLKRFHDLYVHTAQRDGFTPRPLAYFQTMVEALGAEDPDRIRLWLATHEGDLVAATIGIRLGGHAWYSYGASSSEKREVRGSNAVQWAMIRDALATGAEVYDLRGITDTLDPEDPHVGLVQFKVGTGGEAVEYAGEWDLPLQRLLYQAFTAYMSRR